MRSACCKTSLIVCFLVVGISGFPVIGHGFTAVPEPPPGVQDPNTLHLTGPAFIAKIKLWKNSDTNVDFLLTGRCGNNTHNDDSTVYGGMPLQNLTWSQLTKGYFETSAFGEFTTIYELCGWSTTQAGTSWILASPVAVSGYSVGIDTANNKEFIEVSVVYLGRILKSQP